VEFAIMGTVFMGCVGIIAMAAILEGLALSLLWGWFMVPLLGLPHLPIVAAMGISLTVGFMTSHFNDNTHDPEKSALARVGATFAHMVLKPAVTVGVGWIIHLFLGAS
jgi:hypothetical protein